MNSKDRAYKTELDTISQQIPAFEAMAPTLTADPKITPETKEAGITGLETLRRKRDVLARIVRLAEEVDEIDLDPSAFGQARSAALADGISRCPIRTAQPGNITMREHLEYLKSQVDADLAGYAKARRDQCLADKSVSELEL